jgi:hypothetical protein
MPKHQRDPVREQFWREAIADWRASGRTIRDFCHERHLARTAFDYWQRELKRRDQPVPSTPKSPLSPQPSKPTPKPAHRTAKSPAFVPVTVVPLPNLAPGTVEVRCPSGHVVTLASANVTLCELFAALATEDASC